MTLKFKEFIDTVIEIDGNQRMKITHAERDISSFGTTEIKYTRRYKCEWVDNNGNSHIQTFHEDELELVDTE